MYLFKYVVYSIYIYINNDSINNKHWDGLPDRNPTICRKKWRKNNHNGETILKVWKGYSTRNNNKPPAAIRV